ncbi:MAG TPA: hypothetical protein VM889_05425 [Candidatus Thermoplasmatota archaeon]|nr:hypothetical protein [Candidatus Thermoplasmatota archaeon]
MPAPDVLFPVMDLVLAGAYAAWFTSFATKARAEDSLRRMVSRHGEVRRSALAAAAGLAALVASYLLAALGGLDPASWLKLAAYPFFVYGVFCLARATFADARGAPA